LGKEGAIVVELPRRRSRIERGKLTAVLIHTVKWPADLERRTREDCARFSDKLPADLANPPVLRLGLALYLNAWFDLDFERNREDYEPIKRSDCFSYASDYDFDFEQAEDLWYYIARMDRGFLKHKKDTAPPPPKPPRGSGGSKPPPVRKGRRRG
jgi:hypothetical protein